VYLKCIDDESWNGCLNEYGLKKGRIYEVDERNFKSRWLPSARVCGTHNFYWSIDRFVEPSNIEIIVNMKKIKALP
jgi:hypothetical protein